MIFIALVSVSAYQFITQLSEVAMVSSVAPPVAVAEPRQEHVAVPVLVGAVAAVMVTVAVVAIALVMAIAVVVAIA